MIYANKKNRKRKLGTQEIPNAPAPKWINPTAVVLALRKPDGTLEPISIESVSTMEKARIVEIASAVVGTQYAILRELFGKRENIVLTIQSEEVMEAQFAKEQQKKFEDSYYGINKKKKQKRAYAPRKKRATKVVKKRRTKK